ncbi:unnamed protein product [Colias eurytheme]|nr:unnamed protein product [Colias eurytheme]
MIHLPSIFLWVPTHNRIAETKEIIHQYIHTLYNNTNLPNRFMHIEPNGTPAWFELIKSTAEHLAFFNAISNHLSGYASWVFRESHQRLADGHTARKRCVSACEMARYAEIGWPKKILGWGRTER